MHPIEEQRDDYDPTERFDIVIGRFNKSIYKLRHFGAGSHLAVSYWQPGDEQRPFRLVVRKDGGESNVSGKLTEQGMMDYLWNLADQNQVNLRS